jgi:hypothetical protein
MISFSHFHIKRATKGSFLNKNGATRWCPAENVSPLNQRLRGFILYLVLNFSLTQQRL